MFSHGSVIPVPKPILMLNKNVQTVAIHSKQHFRTSTYTLLPKMSSLILLKVAHLLSLICIYLGFKFWFISMYIFYCLFFAVLLNETFLHYLYQRSPPEHGRMLQMFGLCCNSSDFTNENIAQTQILNSWSYLENWCTIWQVFCLFGGGLYVCFFFLSGWDEARTGNISKYIWFFEVLPNLGCSMSVLRQAHPKLIASFLLLDSLWLMSPNITIKYSSQIISSSLQCSKSQARPQLA